MRRATTLFIAMACASIGLAACNKQEAAPVAKPAAAAPAPAPKAAAPAPAPVAAAPVPVATAPAPQPAAPAAPAPAPVPVLATAEYNNDPALRCDVLEVKRVSGGTLTVRWRLVYVANPSQSTVASEPKYINYQYSWPMLYYTDPAENKKYSYLTDSQGAQLVQAFEGRYTPGQQRGNWAKFPAPPATSKKITLHIPHFPPFEDLPVAD